MTVSCDAIGNVNQLLIRREKIDVKIILRESSEASKYELFQRLNTGGSPLSDQELRNAILTMVNSDAYNWLADLAADANFKLCTPLTDRAKSQQYDLELVTRFVVFRRMDERGLKSVGDLGEFLTDRMVTIAEPPTFSSIRSTEEDAFKFTFAKLGEFLGEESFRKYDGAKQSHSGPFLISAYEPIAMGLGYNFENYCDGRASLPEIGAICKKIWSNQQFLNYSGSGVRASSRIPANIPLGRQLFAP